MITVGSTVRTPKGLGEVYGQGKDSVSVYLFYPPGIQMFGPAEIEEVVPQERTQSAGLEAHEYWIQGCSPEEVKDLLTREGYTEDEVIGGLKILEGYIAESIEQKEFPRGSWIVANKRKVKVVGFSPKGYLVEVAAGKFKVVDIPFNEFVVMTQVNKEGIVLLGAGGDLDQWIEGVSGQLKEEEIATSGDPADLWEHTFYRLTTTGGRTDLAMIFKSSSNVIDIGKMAMWRLRFGDCSWISDYIVNYRNQHGVKECPKCGEPMTEEDGQLGCDNCGHSMSAELLKSAAPSTCPQCGAPMYEERDSYVCLDCGFKRGVAPGTSKVSDPIGEGIALSSPDYGEVALSARVVEILPNQIDYEKTQMIKLSRELAKTAKELRGFIKFSQTPVRVKVPPTPVRGPAPEKLKKEVIPQAETILKGQLEEIRVRAQWLEVMGQYIENQYAELKPYYEAVKTMKTDQEKAVTALTQAANGLAGGIEQGSKFMRQSNDIILEILANLKRIPFTPSTEERLEKIIESIKDLHGAEEAQFFKELDQSYKDFAASYDEFIELAPVIYAPHSPTTADVKLTAQAWDKLTSFAKSLYNKIKSTINKLDGLMSKQEGIDDDWHDFFGGQGGAMISEAVKRLSKF